MESSNFGRVLHVVGYDSRMDEQSKTPETNQPKSKVGKRGGARSGAGRKPGSATKKTREIANRVAATGKTPLEVMIEAMRETYKEHGAVAAFPFARDAAPYMHARIASMELTGKGGGQLMPQTIIVCGPDE